MKKNKGWAWFVHHQIKLEYCTDMAGRIEFIKEMKPVDEVPARLFALRWVKDKLPEKLAKAWTAYDKARTAYEKAGKAHNKTWKAYVKAREACVKARKACTKAREAHNKTWKAYVKAREAYVKAREAYEKTCKSQIDALFAKECPDVPWDERNQTLIF